MTVWVVLTVGLILGLAHAVYVYPVAMVRDGDSVNRPSATTHVAWTFLLWVLLGFYVIGLWLIGSVLYLLLKAFR